VGGCWRQLICLFVWRHTNAIGYKNLKISVHKWRTSGHSWWRKEIWKYKFFSGINIGRINSLMTGDGFPGRPKRRQWHTHCLVLNKIKNLFCGVTPIVVCQETTNWRPAGAAVSYKSLSYWVSASRVDEWGSSSKDAGRNSGELTACSLGNIFDGGKWNRRRVCHRRNDDQASTHHHQIGTVQKLTLSSANSLPNGVVGSVVGIANKR